MDVKIGKGLEITVDVDALPEAARNHVIYMGLRNILMDSHASITKETNPTDYADVAMAMAEKKLASLMAGEVRTVTSREGDPVKAEALRMATAIIKDAWRKSGKALKDLDVKVLRDKATILAARADIVAKAEAAVAVRADAEVDLEDIGL